jgi:deoxyribodipyrimidine photo-lyase
MKKEYQKSLFIFRRDLRLEDNTALINALKSSECIVPCFILDPRQVESKNNEYKSNNALQFMIESLKDLDRRLSLLKHDDQSRLYLFYGEQENVVKKLISCEKIDAVYINKDYTPFSKKRDNCIAQICYQSNVAFYQYADSLINEPEFVIDDNGKPFKIFSYFLKKSIIFPINSPQIYAYNENNFYIESIESEVVEKEDIYKIVIEKPNEHIYTHGGRKNCLKILMNLNRFKDYPSERDYPAKQQTTGLSAHIKFGTCSIREVYHSIKNQLGIDHLLIKQLYWRDFFTYIAHHFPYIFGKAFHQKYDKIKWDNNKTAFKIWCDGITGFPIVDAGMRQLNKTGFMSNRLRMIVASFLTKDLHIDWRCGEKYFAQKLVDYDPCVNNGSWQWAASTGCNVQHYLRTFNPWIQQKKIDPECEYIKKWVTELKDVPVRLIHNLDKQRPLQLIDYPIPILDHYKEIIQSKNMFVSVR